MTNIHIPPEAVEAAEMEAEHGNGSMAAVIRAALENWPGMTTRTGLHTDLILPLNTEPRDDTV